MSTLSEIEAATDELPHVDQLRLMEALWVKLSRKGELASPAWHGDALAETERRLEEGLEEVIDWQRAKAELRAKAP